MDATKENFFNQYKWDAIYNHIIYSVPASITLAQAGIESNYGKSRLAKEGNNFFGIKAYSNPDNLPVIYANDDAPNEPFRKYPSARASFKDHSKFLIDNKRYNTLFDNSNIYGWAYGLQAKGYATNPNYANTLLNEINNYDLQRYDFYGNNKYLILFFAFALLVALVIAFYKLYKYLVKW